MSAISVIEVLPTLDFEKPSSKFCNAYLQNEEKFKWFIVKYFGEETYMVLSAYAQSDSSHELMSRLQTIWFFLPDHIFNIMNMPSGWSEFLGLLEWEDDF